MFKVFILLLLSGSFVWISCTPGGSASESVKLDHTDPEIFQMLESVSEDTLQKNIEKLVSFRTRHTLSETDSDTFGIGGARRWIKNEMDRYSSEAGGRMQVEFHRFIQEPGRRVVDSTEVVNVVATLPGTDPLDDRVFVVSAHYDSRISQVMDYESISPGANDDGSGTAAVMEMARIMAGYEFAATLVFLAFAGEEQGLLGARRWALEASGEGKNIAGMVTNDIIGNHEAGDGALSDPYKVRLFARGIAPSKKLDMETLRYLQTGGESDMATRQLARTIKEAAESYLPEMEVWLIYRADRYLRGGDHLAFLERGYPAVRFSEPHEDYRYQHQDIRTEENVQYGDLAEFIDYDYLGRVTKVNLSAFANLARSPLPPSSVGMNISRLENDTRLRWSESPSENLGGYEVLWRETTSPMWQHKKFVGRKTHYTAGNLSKDNWIFGVRSVSRGGHAGVPVYPIPFRE